MEGLELDEKGEVVGGAMLDKLGDNGMEEEMTRPSYEAHRDV